MIISYSGKIGSGKDLCGKITQYLTRDIRYITYSYEEYQTIDDSFHKFDVKRFAGKVKQVCSILTGIPVADFEKQEVKDRVLGEEWNRFYGAMYDMKFNTNPKGRITRNCATANEVRDLIDGVEAFRGKTYEIVEESINVRTLLQEVGTDAMRNVIHPNVWVNALFAEYKGEIIDTRKCEGCYSSPLSIHDCRFNYHPEDKCDYYNNNGKKQIVYPNWIITDTRFPNEAEAIRSRGGLLIRVNRTQWKNYLDMDRTNPNYERDHHPSETSLDNYQFDEVIDNNGSIEELIEKVKVILIKHKII